MGASASGCEGEVTMSGRLLTPSKITAWLDCAHYLTLKHEVEAGTRPEPTSPFGEMAQMLLDKGLAHEQAVLQRFRDEGRSVLEVPERHKGESFTSWVERIGNPLADGYDVIFQMPLAHNGVRGIADFLIRTQTGDHITYEPLDAKLARNEAKPGHVLQLCFYAEAIEALTGTQPEHLHLALGSGDDQTIRTNDVIAYWRRLRHQLVTLLDEEHDAKTEPERCDHCGFCEFELVCDEYWRTKDSLINVADLHRAPRALIEEHGVTTIAGLATVDDEIAGIDTERRHRYVSQAALQVTARDNPDDKPPYSLLASAPAGPGDGGVVPEPTGFAAMPAPDDGDVFLDFEGHPFWRPEAELFFLFGLIERSAEGEWTFREFWAHDVAGESAATKQLVDYLASRRAEFPGMHVYHYNHTERSSLERLTSKHGVAERQLEELIKTGAFIDLLPVLKGAMQVGVESYSLKQIERLTDYERGHVIDKGAGAVVEYEKWMADQDPERLRNIAAYNEDDVRALRAVRDWLVDQRPTDAPWRAAVLDTYEPDPEVDARIDALHAYGPETVEHLMGDLLGYWRRESSVVSGDTYRLSVADHADQLESPSAIAGMEYVGDEDQFSPKTGNKLKWPVKVFRFPPQTLGHDVKPGETFTTPINEQEWAFFSLKSIDLGVRELHIEWNQKKIDTGVLPASLAHFPNYPPRAKLDALCNLADEMLAGKNRVGHAILRRDTPSFVSGGGPANGSFTRDTNDIRRWVLELNDSFVPIQGPPGTGKTFTGAHMVHALVKAGRRVGITAMSHQAIDNVMEAVVKRFAQEGDANLLKAVRKNDEELVAGVQYIDDNDDCASGDFNVLGGTPWFFASQAMRDNPVDVLIVDEAGQLGLADTLAASISTSSLILLGDPRQLPQVAQAAHPNESGASALEHIIGDELTVPPNRGVLLDVTYRMHPDVCGFVSDVVYGGRLSSDASCSHQLTSAGTGLRWIEAKHTGRSTESPEEAELVVETIAGLIGTDWTDEEGETSPLMAADFMVVAPYNDQRRCVQAALDSNPVTRGVEVGTVDKFQGREAAIVLFTMATSSAEFMPRSSSFLFSKNRLNVAISRARCLAYLICTDELLDTRANSVDEMELISALCSFAERADPT